MAKSDETPARETLAARAEEARRSLTSCTQCELRCGVDRLGGERGPCGLSGETWSFKRHLSFAEEPELTPSYMVYLDGCNLRCRFCVQGPTCFSPTAGDPIDPRTLARELEAAVRSGAHTINLIGGEPSLHVHAILAVAAEARMPLPLLLNSNMYMTPEVLDLLDGVIDTYVADFKFGNDRCAERLAAISSYVSVVTRNLLHADRQARVLVRHLLMPGHLDCCFEPVATWTARHLPHARFSLMEGYVPAWRTVGVGGPLGRTLEPWEIAEARARASALGLRMTSPEEREAPTTTTGPGEDPIVTIRIDRNGRMLLHDITKDLLPIVHALRPDDPRFETGSTTTSVLRGIDS